MKKSVCKISEKAKRLAQWFDAAFEYAEKNFKHVRKTKTIWLGLHHAFGAGAEWERKRKFNVKQRRKNGKCFS